MRPFGGTRLPALVAAECRKMWASWIPLAVLLTTVLVTSLFAFEVYVIELPASPFHPTPAQAISALLFATWKTLLFPAAIVAFCAFWVTLDSQYGMIRVNGCQPLSRTDLALGRWLALSAYVALFTAAFVGTQIAWAAASSGTAPIRAELAALGRFSVELTTFTLALAWTVMAVSSTRRTVGSGIITAYLVLIGLALMTMLPYDRVPPRLVFMRYLFFAHQELTNPWVGEPDSPFARVFTRSDFWLTVTVTPLFFTVPALLHFRRRDITE